jgi:hypothetical protein
MPPGVEAGILGMTSMMSADLKDMGITVNVILPSAHAKLFSGGGRRTSGTICPSPNTGTRNTSRLSSCTNNIQWYFQAQEPFT